MPLNDRQECWTNEQTRDAAQLTIRTDTHLLFPTIVQTSDLDDTVAPPERDAERLGLAFTVDIVG